MKNKLTLKSLKQKLENMKVNTPKKANATIDKGVVGHDINNSYINKLYSKSGAMWLYIITGVLSYGHKIPYIGRIITFIGAIYARTTIVKILIKLRKIFIVFNALIGVYMVFKTVGFSTDNLIGGFIAVGETYLQTLFNLTSKLFHWFVELFDHKVVPNVPGDNGGTWFSKPNTTKSNNSLIIPSNLKLPDILDTSSFSLRNIYKDSVPPSNSWFSFITDSNTWWWVAVSAGVFGVIYLGYNIYSDPSYLSELFSNKPRTHIHPPTPPTDPNEDITLAGTIFNATTDFSRKIVNVYNTTINALNPFNYFITNSELQSQFNLFMEVQSDINRSNRKLFPFTENNPFDPWYKKLRLHYFGESGKEFVERNQLLNKADAIYNSLRIKGKGIDLSNATPIFSAGNSAWNSTVTSPALSPITTTIGLHSSVLDAFNAATAAITQEKFSSIPNSPSNIPLDLSNLWGEPTIEELESRIRIVKNPLPSSSSNPTIVEVSSPTGTITPTNQSAEPDMF